MRGSGVAGDGDDDEDVYQARRTKNPPALA